jgi:histidine triad (HIT) family protein
MTDCIFCKIVAGEIPSCRVYEDEYTLAFMDIAPIVKGHTLVIPRKHYDPLVETPTDILAACMKTVRIVMKAQMQSLHIDGANVHQANGAAAGQVVPHLHFHVIPRFENDNHHWNWKAGAYDTPEEMQTMSARIANSIQPEETTRI